MLFSLEHGETADFITSMARRLGQPIPDHLANAPQLEFGLYVYLSAFYELDSERKNSQGIIGRIPWSVIMDYAAVYNFDERQRNELLMFVKRLDAAYIKHFNEKTAKQ